MTDFLPLNALPQERAIAEAIDDRLSMIPVTIRELWNPDTCPAEQLPLLAWAFSVDEWQESWPEHIKRGVIRSSVANHRIKGTRQAVESAVQGLGSDITITEWFEYSPPGTPYTFDAIINYNGESVIAGLQESVAKAIDRTKPARAHYTVQTGISAQSSLNIGAACRVVQYARLEFSAQ